MRIVLLLSGGLDSATALYELKSEGHELVGLGVNYGQRHFKELHASEALAAHAGIRYRICDISNVRNFIGGSSQTSDEVAVPEGHYTEESMKLTVVPNRNMIFLSLAMGWAISLKFDAVAYAAHAGDHVIYPDCRVEFIEAMGKAAELCDWHQVKLLAPYSRISKSEIVKRGARLQVPYALTWSCYKGSENHCGKCGTCVERKEAFQLAGVPDPTEYAR